MYDERIVALLEGLSEKVDRLEQRIGKPAPEAEERMDAGRSGQGNGQDAIHGEGVGEDGPGTKPQGYAGAKMD